MRRGRNRKLTVPFGLREGKLWFVADVASGLECGCTCPECGERLVARNREFDGRKRVRHFQHANTSACSGGVETAVHRMAKEVLASAKSFLLPQWASGDVVIAPEALSVIDTRLEVPLLDGYIRPDALLHGLAGEIDFDALCVEVRVHHAVDDAKGQLFSTQGMNVVEVDLSTLNDETIADAAAFRREVLENANNRKWIHLACGQYVTERTERGVIEIEDTTVTERVIITKAGRPFKILEQWAFLVKPGSREQVRIQIPDETVGECAVPYPRGLHSISGRSITIDRWSRLRLRYKMYLDKIEMNPTETESAQPGLFETSRQLGPGFNVLQRPWKGTPGL